MIAMLKGYLGFVRVRLNDLALNCTVPFCRPSAVSLTIENRLL